MLEEFKSFIQEKSLFQNKDCILLAVSGGIDSVVLCRLFHQAGYAFAIAHCNFQLRGEESDKDELFVADLAKQYKVPFHGSRFSTSFYAEQHNVSIQVAARELRYNWFEELRNEHTYSYVATAHHQDDEIETFFINLVRGTGISGLRGMLEKRERIVRPLLFTTKKEIVSYAKKEDISYREDSSNLCDTYTRNKIRHHVIPLLKELNSKALANMIASIANLRDVEHIFLERIAEVKKEMIVKENNYVKITIEKLKKLNPLGTYLFELLKDFGFNASTVEDIKNSLDHSAGKIFYSNTHKLLKDRSYLLVKPREYEQPFIKEEFLIEAAVHKIDKPICLQFEIIKKADWTVPSSTKSACLDYNQLRFPLLLRKWKQGDSFQPQGMKGKKKLSDFLIDLKVSRMDKENTWVLCSGKDIVWVIGYRIDERYKVHVNTSLVYKVTWYATT